MESEQNKIKIILPRKIAEGIYINWTVITHSQAEFVIDFAKVMDGVDTAAIESRVVTNPIAFKEMSEAMVKALKRYEKRYGAIIVRDKMISEISDADTIQPN